MNIRTLLGVIVFCGSCGTHAVSHGGAVSGPAGFHVACFDINGRPYINTVGTAWDGDVDGVVTVTMDTGLKATIHGERCLIEEMSPLQWSEVHRPSPLKPSPPPQDAGPKPDAGPKGKE